MVQIYATLRSFSISIKHYYFVLSFTSRIFIFDALYSIKTLINCKNYENMNQWGIGVISNFDYPYHGIACSQSPMSRHKKWPLPYRHVICTASFGPIRSVYWYHAITNQSKDTSESEKMRKLCKKKEGIHEWTHLRYSSNFNVFLRYLKVLFLHMLKFKPIYVYAWPLHPLL